MPKIDASSCYKIPTYQEQLVAKQKLLMSRTSTADKHTPNKVPKQQLSVLCSPVDIGSNFIASICNRCVVELLVHKIQKKSPKISNQWSWTVRVVQIECGAVRTADTQGYARIRACPQLSARTNRARLLHAGALTSSRPVASSVTTTIIIIIIICTSVCIDTVPDRQRLNNGVM